MSVLTHHRPILSSGATASSRARRDSSNQSEEDCSPSDNESRCCRYPWTVSFRDIGWHHWIIQPESYEAFYCHGSCPFGFRVAHRFGTVKSILRAINGNSVLNLDCAPTRLGPLNIAHYNADGRLVVSVFDGMLIEECGCI